MDDADKDEKSAAVGTPRGRLTVLQVIPALDAGGAERGCVDVATALVAAGHRAIVVSSGGRMVRELERSGAEHIELPVDSKNPFLMKRNVEALRSIFLREHVDVVHARSRAPAWCAYWATRAVRLPFLTTFHSKSEPSNILKRFYNSVMVRSDLTIAISDYVADRLKTQYPQADPVRIRTVPRGIDLTRFSVGTGIGARVHELADRWRVPHGKDVILLPGRLTRWKGQTVAVEMARLLSGHIGEGFLLVLAGDDQGRRKYRRDLEGMIERYGLAVQTRITGHCDDMPAAYALADVVIVPSLEPEAFGRVPVEAIAMGRPVVASDHGGARETMEDSPLGFLVPPGDADAMAHAVLEALSIDPDTRRRLAEIERQRIESRYTVDAMCHATLRIYEDLVAGAGDRILVIKLGALGDFVQALGPMRAIRAHHDASHITLLTTPPFGALARASGLFDEVWTDGRPAHFDVPALFRLSRKFRRARFRRVYDLQTSSRSGFYYRLFGWRRPEWSGIVRGASHPHQNSDRDRMHTLDRQADQLRTAGIEKTPPPDIAWAGADIGRFGLPKRYALLVPGGSSHRISKRWPGTRYSALARRLIDEGITPVLIGGSDEQGLGKEIAENAPGARSLMGETSLEEIAVLARGAVCAIGNDTGPMHLVALAGRPTVVLFSKASDPDLCAPRGENVRILQRADLADLGEDEVCSALRPMDANQ